MPHPFRCYSLGFAVPLCRFVDGGRPPFLPFSLLASDRLSDLIARSIAAALMSVPQLGQVISGLAFP